MHVYLAETPGIVAAVACATEVPVVNVVQPVTIDAAPVITAELIQGPVVTTVAMNVGVRMTQLEVCIVVVETPGQPCVGIVTFVATVPEALFVDIVGTMTVDTGVAGITEYRGCMTAFAAERRMLSYQWEAAQVMIKADLCLPGNFVMTLVTSLALFILVSVVLPVTAVTVGINFLCFCADQVTCLAGEIAMRTIECEVGVCIVVKFGILPCRDDVTVLAFFPVQLVMNIIGTMAAVTVARSFIKLFRNPVVFCMTVVTALPTMLAFEFVPGIPVMIEN